MRLRRSGRTWGPESGGPAGCPRRAPAEVRGCSFGLCPTCYEHGAYTSAIIMLGSLLEGVLPHAAQVRTAGERMPKPLRSLGLNDFVDFAFKDKWIERDAKLASELVRHYRNLVHPPAEKKTGRSPDRDTLDMCWPVVNATLNDLAETVTAPPASDSVPAPSEPGRGRQPPSLLACAVRSADWRPLADDAER